MAPPWIASRLGGGLGNRLFQVAVSINVAIILKTEVVFLLCRTHEAHHGNYKLLFDLFPNIRILETASDWIEIDEGGTIPETDKGIVLKGYFQCSWHIPPMSSLPSIPSESTDTLEVLDTWAVHFRFGDYCILPFHQIDLRAYYYQTITRNIPSNTKLLLFSDSLEKLPAIAEELKVLGYNVEIYKNPDTLSTLKAFVSCGGGAVCGNSTFAWWASLFASKERPSYRAFFPDTWMRQDSPKAPPILDLPFTKAVDISELPASPRINSFSY